MICMHIGHKTSLSSDAASTASRSFPLASTSITATAESGAGSCDWGSWATGSNGEEDASPSVAGSGGSDFTDGTITPATEPPPIAIQFGLFVSLRAHFLSLNRSVKISNGLPLQRFSAVCELCVCVRVWVENDHVMRESSVLILFHSFQINICAPISLISFHAYLLLKLFYFILYSISL